MKLPSKKPKRSRYGTQAASTASATGLKDRLTALKPKQGSKKESKSAKAKPAKTEASAANPNTPKKFERITNETVAAHREEILAGGRKFKHPVQVSRRRVIINTIIVALVAALLLAAVAWQQLYIAQSSNNLLYRMTQIFPVPVASIDGELVRYSDYLVQYRGSKFYLGKYDEIRIDSDDGREQLKHIKRESLNRALVDTYAAKLARQHNITVSEQDIDTVIEQQRNTANGKISQETYDASSRMMYNWSPSDYRQAVRRSIVRARVAFAVDKTADELQRKAAGLVASSNGEFAKIATQLGGSGRSKPQVGDSGLINLASSYNGLAVSEIAKLEPGKPSGAIKSTTDSGYYFVKVNEKNDSKIRFTYLYIPLTELTKQVAQLKSDGKVQEYIDVPQK